MAKYAKNTREKQRTQGKNFLSFVQITIAKIPIQTFIIFCYATTILTRELGIPVNTAVTNLYHTTHHDDAFFRNLTSKK